MAEQNTGNVDYGKAAADLMARVGLTGTKPPFEVRQREAIDTLDSRHRIFLDLYKMGHFNRLSGSELKNISLEGGVYWRQPPLVDSLITPATTHLWLTLRPCEIDGVETPGWTADTLDHLCAKIPQVCTSLQCIVIDSGKPEGSHPGLSSKQLKSLLRELHGLTSLHLEYDLGKDAEQKEDQIMIKIKKIDRIISTVACNNPGMRELHVPVLTKSTLSTISEKLPQLVTLEADIWMSSRINLQAFLSCNKNLQTLKLRGERELDTVVSDILLDVARSHGPASASYQLSTGFLFYTYKLRNHADEEWTRLFTAFPAGRGLHVDSEDIQSVTDALEGLEDVRIESLEVEDTTSNPRVLEPLLARVGEHLTRLYVSGDNSSVDLNMLGRHCHNLKHLDVILWTPTTEEESHCHFPMMETLIVGQHNDCDEVPAHVIAGLLASPMLKKAELGVSITEECMALLVSDKGRDHELALEEVTVWTTTPDFVEDAEGLALLIRHAPRLRKLTVLPEGECSELRGVLTAVIKAMGRDIELSISPPNSSFHLPE